MGCSCQEQGDPTSLGMLPTCRIPCSPPVTLTPAASSSLPSISLEASLKPGLSGTAFPWKMRNCVVRHTLQGYSQDTDGLQQTPDPQFPPSVQTYTLELSSFLNLPILPGWKWSGRVGSPQVLTKLVTVVFLGPRPVSYRGWISGILNWRMLILDQVLNLRMFCSLGFPTYQLVQPQ